MAVHCRIDKNTERQIMDFGDGSKEYVKMEVFVLVADANTLAAAKIVQGKSSLYAADAKPPANVLADALVAAGHGMGE
jgi:hypothetical protein